MSAVAPYGHSLAAPVERLKPRGTPPFDLIPDRKLKTLCSGLTLTLTIRLGTRR